MPKLKRSQSLPEDAHIMRHVPHKLQQLDEDGNVVGFWPAAFAHRDGEDYLSVNWLEYFDNTHAANVAQCKQAIAAVRKGVKAKFGVAAVDRVRALAKHNSKPVRIVYYPSGGNLSHSAFFVDQPVPDAVCEDLARAFFQEHY